MKNSKKYISACLAASVLLVGGVIVNAKRAQSSIEASYQNIKLVVDGEYVEPKDINGNYVEPFIYNGTTYLPVRAVGEAFEKDVTWNGQTATVDLHEHVPVMEDVALYNRPYEKCFDASKFEFYDKDGYNYIRVSPSSNRVDLNDITSYNNYVEYNLLGKADRLTGEFYLDDANDSTEGKLKIYNSEGKVIYTSPNMRINTTSAKFDVDVTGVEKVRLVFEAKCTEYYHSRRMLVKNLTAHTSAYN